jgi:hypothetical protein
MRISYSGQMRNHKYNTRSANIEWNEDNPAEEKLAERIIHLAENTTHWQKIDGYNGMFTVSVENREDYEDFVKWYKQAKKMFRNCAKYGF